MCTSFQSPPTIENRHPLSSQLVIHCHGGGYVATSSRSHEVRSYCNYYLLWLLDLRNLFRPIFAPGQSLSSVHWSPLIIRWLLRIHSLVQLKKCSTPMRGFLTTLRVWDGLARRSAWLAILLAEISSSRSICDSSSWMSSVCLMASYRSILRFFSRWDRYSGISLAYKHA